MRHGIGLSVVLGLVCLTAGRAVAMDCTGLPTTFSGNEFPKGDFFSNFNNTCYTIPFTMGDGNGKYGDLNAQYFQMYYKVDPRYQLVIVSAFPNSRYYSITLYDEHSATAQTILDENIVPLTSQYINPYKPGVAFADGQQFAAPITFGGTPGTQETGCKMDGYNVTPNTLDATQRHPGMDWNTNPDFFAQYPTFSPHIVDTPQHTNPNGGGVVLIRAYIDATVSSYQTNPHIIVRDVATGCAYPKDYALNTLHILDGSSATGSAWLDSKQEQAHHFYETSYLPKQCFANPPSPNRLPWTRQPEYIAGGNPDASYIVATVPTGLPQTLAAAGQVMRIRFQMPTVPATPCTNGCSRSGTEQMRYRSLSFLVPGGSTIASLADTAFVKDPNGYATLIVGTGAAVPSWVTASNYYTYFDLTQIAGYDQLNLLDLRDLIPSGAFNCAGQFTPYRTGTATPDGSLMGPYAPVVDYPAAATLPQVASPLASNTSCGTFPIGTPGVRPSCGVLPLTPPAIVSATTVCTAPMCSSFVAQSNPTITIAGSGFGQFPLGQPYDGNSDYIQISNATKRWRAGYTGTGCTVSIRSWTDSLIEVVANVNENGKCPLVAGDQLQIKVWNPQSMTSGNFLLTAQ
ncbi:MAG: hypothetical protein U0Q18_15985 [Bryobacteraceae bacterium]